MHAQARLKVRRNRDFITALWQLQSAYPEFLPQHIAQELHRARRELEAEQRKLERQKARAKQ